MKTEHTYMLTACAAFVLPIAFAGGARFVGAGPGTALATISEPPPRLPELDPIQDRAQIDPATVARSPFWDKSSGGYIPEPILPDPEPRTGQPETGQIRLTAVMPSARTPLAVINGRPRRIGDRIDSVWTLTAIDGDARTVTIRSSTGQERTVTLSR